MKKSFAVFLSTAPYYSENTLTAARLLEEAMRQGHSATLVASGDGVYAFLRGQKPRGVPHAADIFSSLMSKGLRVFL